MAEKNLAAGTRGVTDYLRGFAIIGVLVSHYRISFSGGSEMYEGYGNALVGIFFILSGYGNYFSLRKLAGQWPRLKPGPIVTFFRHRAIRIYPEYFLALGLSFWLYGREITVLDVLGLKSIYWFVHSIIQCYLAAPLLYYGLIRLGPRRLFLAASLLFILANAAHLAFAQGFPSLAFPETCIFRSLVFANVYLFCLGMLLPFAVSALRGKIPERKGAFFLAVYLVFALVNGVSAYGYAMASGIAFVAATFGVCLALLAAPGGLPGGPVIRVLGRASYPLYLFEPFYYYALARSGITLHGAQGLAVYLVFFPLFLAACMAIDRGFSFLARR